MEIHWASVEGRGRRLKRWIGGNFKHQADATTYTQKFDNLVEMDQFLNNYHNLNNMIR